ncbi:DUF2382 domain-containing protein [Kribbella sp. DT2]|uniref:DUF2382 domain-containing protein n=1 Tax=Kribbella sp. DT2 TaxID=3393427 RepID=UPI003CE8FB0C
MSTAQELERTIGQDVYDVEGQKVGTAANLYASDLSGEPEWVTVKTGLFGSKESFVPLAGARAEQDGLHVGQRKDLIKDAPRIDDQGHLSETEASELYRHYNMQAGGMMPGQNMGTDRGTGKNPAGKNKDMKGTGREEMVRSEERLRAGTETVETGKVRLHKRVVTEEQQVTIPVSHEEVHVVREPIENGRAGGKIGEEDVEVTLHEERPVVAKETVAVERVGLDTETVREDKQVSEKVRKEQVDIVDDADPKHRKR